MGPAIRNALAGLCAAVATAGAGAAGAEAAVDCVPAPPERGAISRALLDGLVGWIALNTTYDVTLTYRAPPEITFCAVGETVPYETAELLVEPFLRAAYDLAERRIYLVRPWTSENPFDVSVLLHELIHDVQHANRDWDCIGAPEFEAYWLQDKWLAEHGVRPGFNWTAIRRLSRCPGD